MTQSTTAVRQRQLVHAKDFLEYARAGLKQFRLDRSHKSTSRAVDGKELAWQERANVTVALEQEDERDSKNMEEAAEVLARMATIDETGTWWLLKDDSPPQSESEPVQSANTHVRVWNENGYDAADPRPFFDGEINIHCRRSPDSW